MADLTEWLRETATLAKQREATAAAAVTNAAGSVDAMLMALPIGTRVIDLVTGEEGVIVDGHRENVVIPLAPVNGG